MRITKAGRRATARTSAASPTDTSLPASCRRAMTAAVALPLVGAVAPAKSADFDYLRYQDKIKEYVVKVRTSSFSSDAHE